ncbi:ComF family protein [Rhodohalobacter halophilus]|uniref:ComF family protein n=1 Tax=Rhodohalobacter halophilus TaxID=1812810 RepID=UPI00114CE048|nr:ComF family protein [Rhodohalobacter halophilus]
MMKAVRPYIDLFFPPVCTCCGAAIKHEARHLCSWCKKQRFSGIEMQEDQILPDVVQFQYSMWSFDKGGYLQQLLHGLKYNYLRKAGVELGETLAGAFLQKVEHDITDTFEQFPPIIVPVPLHKSKFRKRGYNQAAALAEGFGAVSGWEIVELSVVVRGKKTSTQTGLSSEKRIENVKNAFQILKPQKVFNRTPIIVDDVFTTGATTFELAQVLSEYSEPAMIVTVARA